MIVPAPDVVGGKVLVVGKFELPLSLDAYFERGLMHDGSGARHVETLLGELELPPGGECVDIKCSVCRLSIGRCA